MMDGQDSLQGSKVAIGNRGNDVDGIGDTRCPSTGGPSVVDQAKNFQGPVPVVPQGSCHCQTRLRII